jgi:hypothetical protein
MQRTRKGPGVSGHFGLIRKQSEMSCRWPEKNFWQVEMSRAFWLLSYETFRDGLRQLLRGISEPARAAGLMQIGHFLTLVNSSRSSIILMFRLCAYKK